MNEFRKHIIEELMKTERKGMDELIDAMDVMGFFKSPCSGKHHLAESEGLMKHSWNVLVHARKLNDAWGRVEADDSIVIAALLHDLGKMGDHGKPNYIEKVLKDGSRSKAEPYTTNKDLVYIPHEVRSVMIAERFIKLKEEEEQAILYHNGLYGDFKYEIQGKESPLYLILHFADMWCSRVVEIEGKEENNAG